jgi:hypothetical protein
MRPFAVALLALAATLAPVAVYSATDGHAMTAVALACIAIILTLLALLGRSPPSTPRPSPLSVRSFSFQFETSSSLDSSGGALVLSGRWGSDQINSWTTNAKIYSSPTYQTMVYGEDGVPIETPITLTALADRLRHDTRLELKHSSESNVYLRTISLSAMLAYQTAALEQRARLVIASIACPLDRCLVTTAQPLALGELADALLTQVNDDERRVRAGEDPWYVAQS